MRGNMGALVAAVVAAASATGAAVWVKRKMSEEEPELKVVGSAAPEATIAKPPEAPVDDADDLTSIKGIGAVSQERLQGAGVTTFAQIAAWSDEDVEAIGAQIKVSPERIRREDWVGQTRAVVEA